MTGMQCVKCCRRWFGFNNGSNAKWHWVKESSTFGFPPSVHGAVGAFSDVTVFYWEMNGGGTFGHGGGTTAQPKAEVTVTTNPAEIKLFKLKNCHTNAAISALYESPSWELT